MRLKLMAPFRSHLCLNAGILPFVEIDNDYIEFWTRIEDAVEKQKAKNHRHFKKIKFMHSDSNVRKEAIPYSSIEEDSLKCALHLLELVPKRTDEIMHESFERAVQKEGGEDMTDIVRKTCTPDPDSVFLRIFDNTISMVEVSLDLHNFSQHVDQSNYQSFLDTLRDVGIAYAYNYITKLYDQAIFPFLKELSQGFDPDSDYIKRVGRYENFNDMSYKPYKRSKLSRGDKGLLVPKQSQPTAMVLWVTRMLILDDAQQDFVNDLVDHWLKDIGDQKEIDKVKADPNAYSLAWLHYLVRENVNAPNEADMKLDRTDSEFDDAWNSMIMSQYYYSALECLNNNLQHVIGLSYSPRADQELRELNRHLKSTMASTNLLIINYNEMQKYLKRSKLQAMKQIMKKWDFDNLTEHAKNKMALCKERIDNLHKVSTERSTLYTDIILLGIGAISIISLLVGLSQYGRTLSADATLGFRDESPLDIFGLISRIPTDLILVLSFAVIVVISVFYYVLRRKRLL
ncbi:hypothetical protein GWO43_20235 [candidate division KSB1 bacterium]|nr:hypothetical protein [candidate division KSB1 bacterium]NIR71723.1 hypothetical protein [candidate division KSB1 bacterium]NIS26404.1 hypothetical protein [candidate division KSB1 bacterium]NIT73163.1 hypothetical protein [candidate division KSB1 bacterium]NIU27090.1 hypothetical protein [candidate division KSB1 bacterium]